MRILRTEEDRDPSWLRTIVELLLLSPTAPAWTVLTVLEAPGRAVATRRIIRRHDAEAARNRFVKVATEMADDEYAAAGWQSVLDQV